jgi:excinuclease UvrABC helicase subunit UvrB
VNKILLVIKPNKEFLAIFYAKIKYLFFDNAIVNYLHIKNKFILYFYFCKSNAFIPISMDLYVYFIMNFNQIDIIIIILLFFCFRRHC